LLAGAYRAGGYRSTTLTPSARWSATLGPGAQRRYVCPCPNPFRPPRTRPPMHPSIHPFAHPSVQPHLTPIHPSILMRCNRGGGKGAVLCEVEAALKIDQARGLLVDACRAGGWRSTPPSSRWSARAWYPTQVCPCPPSLPPCIHPSIDPSIHPFIRAPTRSKG
jgi:hypothetical protein